MTPTWKGVLRHLRTGSALLAISATGLRAQVRAELIPEHTELRPGDRTRVAIVLRHAPGWHTYWRRGGDAGAPTRIEWTVPSALRVDTLQWPAPSRFVDQGVVSFGYDVDVPLVADLIIDAKAPSGATRLTARVDWLACKTQCVPGGTVVQGAVRTGAHRLVNPAFARAMGAPGVLWPVRSSEAVAATLDGDSLRLSATPSARTGCHFFPETVGIPAEVSMLNTRRDGRPSAMALSRARRGALPDTMRGVLRCTGPTASASYHRVRIAGR
jgi:thiol:disulfide interchange protein DsbD